MLVEVEPVTLPLLYLRQVVVQGLLGDVHHTCSILQGHLLPYSYSRVELSPTQHLLNHVLDLSLLQSTALQVVVPLLLRHGLALRIRVALLHDGFDVFLADQDGEGEGLLRVVIVVGDCHFELGTE